MTPEEQIVKMTTAIKEAIRVMGDRFGSTEQDVAKAVQGLKMSMQASVEADLSMKTLPRSGSQLPQDNKVTAGT
jgi:hypothetical protein